MTEEDLWILFFIFLVLKLCKVIDWAWWWVVSPLWIPIAIIVFVIILALIFGFIAGKIKGGKNE